MSFRAAKTVIKSALASSSVAAFRSTILARASDVAKKNGSFVMDEALAFAYKSDKASSRRTEMGNARKVRLQQNDSVLDLKQGPMCNVIERAKLLLIFIIIICPVVLSYAL